MRVARTIEEATVATVGEEAVLKVEVLDCEVSANAPLDRAVPEPGGRFGKPTRWRLMDGRQQRGRATAVVSGEVMHVQTVRSIASGALVDQSDVRVVTSDVSGALIERLPDIDAVVGARALRGLTVGEIVTVRTARIPPAVRSGDRVTVRSSVGSVEATGVAIAQQSGEIGDVIRLVNPDSRQPLRARITGKGAVEVIHGS